MTTCPHCGALLEAPPRSGGWSLGRVLAGTLALVAVALTAGYAAAVVVLAALILWRPGGSR